MSKTIAITPAMIEAGVGAMYAYENDEKWCSSEDRVAAIFRAMIDASDDGRRVAQLSPCPKCGKKQPMGDRCVECGLEFAK